MIESLTSVPRIYRHPGTKPKLKQFFTMGDFKMKSQVYSSDSMAPRHLADKLREVAEQLHNLSETFEPFSDNSDPVALANLSDAQMHDICRKIYAARRRRDEFFPVELFAEPAWDILLDVFIHQTDGGPLSVKQACIGAHVANSTALRYLRLLQDENFISIAPCKEDRRARKVRMTSQGFRKMRDYIISGIAREQLPLPKHH